MHVLSARLLPFLAVIVLAACAITAQAPPAVVRSELDKREYRYLELPNHLRVMLVSDPAADKSAASLRVQTGSGDDPADRQGLAHFLEHMLFLGTAKYPDSAEYQDFINAHGGSHNAYTAVDHTNFFFDIEPDSLEPALDRFAQFFVAPLFTPEYVQREANAVDSEYRMGLKDDARREYDVLRELVQPAHPLAKLAVGNLQTLRPTEGDIRAELLAFHERHYSANLMTLVVLGKQPLDQLESLVRPRFEPIGNRNAAALETVPPMFAAGLLPLEVRIRPEKETREIAMLFPVPSSRERPAAKPLDYIGNLLGHEGPGGLLSVLKARGLAEGLSAGAGFDLFGQDAFQVTVQLTASGLVERDAVVALVFKAISQLREGGVEPWRYREQAALGDLGFRFKEKGSASASVIAIANGLADYPVADVLRGPYLYADYDAGFIGSYLAQLRPDNMLLTVTDHSLQTDRESRWFDAPYATRRLDAAALADAAAKAASLALPAPNEFLPDRVATKPLAAGAGARPVALADESGYRLWHLQDAEFPGPKASLYVQLLSARATATARDAALGSLFAMLVQDDLNEFAYPATLAGLQYGISPSSRGLSLKLGGYDQRMDVLLDKILRSLQRSSFPAERFGSLKTELLRELGNSDRERPYTQLIDRLGNTMVRRSYTDAELRAALTGATEQDLADFATGLRSGASVEVLAHGNLLADEALALGLKVRDALRGEPGAAVPAIEVLALPGGESVRSVAIEHPDSALLMYLQGSAPSVAERARVALAGQVLGPSFFNELRTERQLGYVVFAQPYPLARAPGLLLGVQSPVADPAALVKEFEAYLARQSEVLGGMSDEVFNGQRMALAARLREKPRSLAEKTERLWSDLGLGSYGFDDLEQVARELETIGRDNWLQWFRSRLAGADRHALVLYSTGQAHRAKVSEAPPGRRVDPDGRWKADAKYYRFEWALPTQDPGRALH
jgi:secreted Zn-dependent insulinase-like peptidase